MNKVSILTTLFFGFFVSALNIGIISAADGTQAKSIALQQSIDVMLKNIAYAHTQIPHMSKAAEAAARQWIAGADIYTAGDECATDELFYRAGGLIGIKRVGPYNRDHNGIQVRWNKVKSKNSVILYSMHRNVNPSTILFEDLNHLRARSHTVIFFGSSTWPACQRLVKELQHALSAERFFFIDTALPADTAFVTADGKHYGDYAGMVTTAHSWAFVGELIAACTRQHKMPAIWPSGAIPQFEAWEEKYQTTSFHQHMNIDPITAGELGKRYLSILQQQIQACEQSTAQLLVAAATLAEIPANKAVYAMIESHLLANETSFPKELPNWILAQRGWRWRLAAPTVESGDAIFWLGAFNWPTNIAQQAHEQNNPFIGVSIFGPGQDPQHQALITADVESAKDIKILNIKPQLNPVTTLPDAVQWIPAPWYYPDAVLAINGYPLPACPTSSIIQGTLLWALIGEILKAQQ